MNPSPPLNEKCFNHKRTRSTGFRNLSLKLVELVWCGDNTFCFLNECLNGAYVFWICCFENVKIVGSWKNEGKRELLLRIWKIIKLILEARKSSDSKKTKKKGREEIEEKERNKVLIQGKKSVLKNPGHL